MAAARAFAPVVPPRIRSRIGLLSAGSRPMIASSRWLSIIGIGEDGLDELSLPHAA